MYNYDHTTPTSVASWMFNNHTIKIASWYNTIGPGPKFDRTGRPVTVLPRLYSASSSTGPARTDCTTYASLFVSVCIRHSDYYQCIHTHIFHRGWGRIRSTHERMARRDHPDDASMCPRTTASAWWCSCSLMLNAVKSCVVAMQAKTLRAQAVAWDRRWGATRIHGACPCVVGVH